MLKGVNKCVNKIELIIYLNTQYIIKYKWTDNKLKHKLD